jgi:hypothetical protein
MKRIIAVLVLSTVAGSLSAATDAQTTTKKSRKSATTPAKTASKPAALTIPRDAVPLGNGTYSYTDKTGKKWLYSNSPFGVMRTEDISAAQSTTPALNNAPDSTKVIDKGEVVRFERPSPFGAVVWEKKKSELNDEERRILGAQDPGTQNAKPETAPENK